VFIRFDQESFLHVFGFLEGVLAVISGIVGLLASRKKYLKLTRPWLTSHAIFAAVCVLVLIIDSGTVTPPSFKRLLMTEITSAPGKSTQSPLASHIAATLYLIILIIHVTLFLSLCISWIVSLVNLRLCSQKGSYDTTTISTETPEVDRL
jgi:hypothetical protein